MRRINIIDAIDRRLDFSKLVFCWRLYDGNLRVSSKPADLMLEKDERFLEASFITHHELTLVEM